MNRVIFIFVFLIGLSGCLRGAFQPPPYTYEEWKRENTSLSEVKQMMLKCGYPSVLGAGREPDNNKIALMHLCMESHGFKYTGEFGTFCKSYPNLPACVEARKEAAAQKSKKTN